MAWAAESIAGDSTGTVAPITRDTAEATVPAHSPPPGRPGVADTVTVLPPVRVRGTMPPAIDRSTATSVRLERASVTRFLPASTADALLSVPGVDLVKTGPWASRVSVRGLSGERVVVLVDGVRLNTPRGHGAQSSLVDLDRLDAVEVLPGANSVLFGSDALGGVVSLVTQRNLFAPVVQLGVTVSARGAEPGGQWGEQARLRLAARNFGAEISGGLGGLEALATPEGRVPNSGQRDRNLGGRAALRWSGAMLDYERTHSAALDVGLPAFNGADGASGMYPLQSRDADRLELTIPGMGPLREARLLGSIQSFRTHYSETTVDSTFLRGRLIATRRTEAADRVRTRATGIQPTFGFAGPGSPRLQLEMRRETAFGPRETDVTVANAAGGVTSHSVEETESVPPARRDVWSASLFAGESWRGLRLESGLRLDVLRSRADSTERSFTPELDVTDRRLSGEGGLSAAIGPIEPYAHVASGFRAPNLDERFFNDDIHGGLRLFGNPDLNPEKSLATEVGARAHLRFGGRLLQARVSAHRSEVDDLITFRYLGQFYGIPHFQYVNVRRARIEGMEYEAKAQAGRATASLNVAFPRGFDLDSGQRLADVGTGRVTLDLGVPLERLLPQGGLSARLRWNDAVWTQDRTLFRPRFTTVSLEGSCVLAGTRAVLAVRNLTNASYREPMSFISEPGRTFAISVRRDFGIALPWGRGS